MKAYAYFDQHGTLKEFIIDPSVRQGNSNINEIMIYMEDDWNGYITGDATVDTIEVQASLKIYTTQEPTPVSQFNTLIDDIFYVEKVPAMKDYDPKFFKYGKDYNFIKYTIPPEALAVSGNARMNLVLFDTDEGVEILFFGMIPFSIEETTALPAVPINWSEYLYLLEIANSVNNKINKSGLTNISNMVWRDTNGIDALAYNVSNKLFTLQANLCIGPCYFDYIDGNFYIGDNDFDLYLDTYGTQQLSLRDGELGLLNDHFLINYNNNNKPQISVKNGNVYENLLINSENITLTDHTLALFYGVGHGYLQLSLGNDGILHVVNDDTIDITTANDIHITAHDDLNITSEISDINIQANNDVSINGKLVSIYSQTQALELAGEQGINLNCRQDDLTTTDIDNIIFTTSGDFTWNAKRVATENYVTEQITSILNGYATENYVQQQIAEAVSNAYKWSGSKTVAELNALTVTASMHGNVYNVTSDGVLNQGNVSVIAGDNVAIVWDAQNNTYLWDKLAGTFTVDLSGYLQKSTSFNSVYATTSNGSQIMIGYSESPTGSGGYLVLRKSNGQISVPETPIADDDATSKKYVDDEHALLDNRVTALEIEVGNQQKVYGIRFTGNAVNGVRLNDAYGLTFDLSQGINDFAIEELFAKIHEVETTAYNSAGQALVDSSGATLKNKFIYIPNFYFKQTLTQDASGNDVVSWFVTEKEKVGFTPIFKNTDGTVPTAFLVGKYETNFGDDTETVVGSFTGKKPVVNVNRDYVHGKTTYVLDASLGVSTLQKVDQSFPKKAWDAIAILISIVTGTRHHQSVFYGITGDSLLNPQDAAIASYQEAGAVNSFVCQKTNYIRTNSEVGSKITIYSSSTQSRRWEQHTITAIEDDVPETGLSKITFDGTATYIASGTVRIGLHCGEPAGATDSISGDFGNLATDNMHAFKVFGIENYFGNFWTILGGAAIEQTWDADAEVAHNKLMLPSGDNYEPGVSYTSFVTTDVELALTEAYVKRLAFKDSVFVPSITGNGASSTTYYADYYYTDKRTAAAPSTAYRTFLGGGHYYSGAYAGSFSFACDRGWTYSVWGCGFRSFLLIQ